VLTVLQQRLPVGIARVSYGIRPPQPARQGSELTRQQAVGFGRRSVSEPYALPRTAAEEVGDMPLQHVALHALPARDLQPRESALTLRDQTGPGGPQYRCHVRPSAMGVKHMEEHVLRQVSLGEHPERASAKDGDALVVGTTSPRSDQPVGQPSDGDSTSSSQLSERVVVVVEVALELAAAQTERAFESPFIERYPVAGNPLGARKPSVPRTRRSKAVMGLDRLRETQRQAGTRHGGKRADEHKTGAPQHATGMPQ
jgi:hypothetical protein